MTAKERLQQIKALFLGEVPAIPATPAAPVVPVAAMAKSYKLYDGTEISVAQAGDMPAIGDAVTINGAPPAPGEYKLEDQSVLVVDAAGLIVEIKPAAPVTTDLSQTIEPAVPVVVAPQVPVQASEVNEKFAAAEAKVSSLEKTIGEYQAKFEAQEKLIQQHEEQLSKQGKTLQDLFDLVEEISVTPTAEPKTLTEAQQVKLSRQSKREDKINRFAEARKAIKATN